MANIKLVHLFYLVGFLLSLINKVDIYYLYTILFHI